MSDSNLDEDKWDSFERQVLSRVGTALSQLRVMVPLAEFAPDIVSFHGIFSSETTGSPSVEITTSTHMQYLQKG